MLPSAARNAIADAFWTLLEKKSVDDITVTDIAKARSITRQAFYYHFQGIPDVIVYAVERYVSDLTDQILTRRDPEEAIALAFSPAVEYPDVIKRLVHSKKYPVFRIVADAVMGGTERALLANRVIRDLNYDAAQIAVRFYAGGLLNVIAGACQEEFIHAGWMAELYYRLLRGELLPSLQPPR